MRRTGPTLFLCKSNAAETRRENGRARKKGFQEKEAPFFGFNGREDSFQKKVKFRWAAPFLRVIILFLSHGDTRETDSNKTAKLRRSFYREMGETGREKYYENRGFRKK